MRTGRKGGAVRRSLPQEQQKGLAHHIRPRWYATKHERTRQTGHRCSYTKDRVREVETASLKRPRQGLTASPARSSHMKVMIVALRSGCTEGGRDRVSSCDGPREDRFVWDLHFGLRASIAGPLALVMLLPAAAFSTGLRSTEPQELVHTSLKSAGYLSGLEGA